MPAQNRTAGRASSISMITLILLLLAGSGSARADQADQSQDGRLFGRLFVGVGYGSLRRDDTDEGLSAHGFAMSADATLGLKLTDDFALHANLFGVNAVGARIEENGRKINEEPSGLLVAGLGPGVTYHVPKLLMYVSFAAGLGWTLVAPLKAPAGFGRVGFGTEALIGKEWWVRRGLAVGLGAQAVYVRVQDAEVDYDGFGGGIGAHFTYH